MTHIPSFEHTVDKTLCDVWAPKSFLVIEKRSNVPPQNAGDSVDLTILCKELKIYGVQQSFHGLILAFPTENSLFRVNGINSKIGGHWSCATRFNFGPLLFLDHTNDLPHAVEGANVSMCADDASLCRQFRDLTRLNEAINSNLMKFYTRLQGNKVSVNLQMLIPCLFPPSRNTTFSKVKIKMKCKTTLKKQLKMVATLSNKEFWDLVKPFPSNKRGLASSDISLARNFFFILNSKILQRRIT